MPGQEQEGAALPSPGLCDYKSLESDFHTMFTLTRWR